MSDSKILGLRTTIYKVADINEAKKWYAQAFGLEPYFDEPYYVGFNIRGYELGLQPEEESILLKSESLASLWVVEDTQKVYDHFTVIGIIEHEKPFNVGGELITATVKDPWSNTIGLLYNPYFKVT